MKGIIIDKFESVHNLREPQTVNNFTLTSASHLNCLDKQEIIFSKNFHRKNTNNCDSR